MNETLKRDNWTNEEVASIIIGYHIKDAQEDFDNAINFVIDELLDLFKFHFSCDKTELGAFAMIEETKEVVHIGQMP